MVEAVVMAASRAARHPEVAVPVAARRAGAVGLLDLSHPDLDLAAAECALAALMSETTGRWGVRARPTDTRLVEHLLPLLVGPGILVLTEPPSGASPWTSRGEGHKRGNLEVLVEVTSVAEARQALTNGADGVVAVGAESGEPRSRSTSFVLLQELLAAIDTPVLVRGGIGLHSAAAALTCGAAGVVLDSQLLLTREARPGHRVRAALRLVDGGDSSESMHEQLRDRLAGSGLDPAALGQDVALAAPLAQRWGTVGRLVQELRRTSIAHVRDALTGDVLGHDSPLAAVHGTRYPLVQGPMTRVSDQPAFALSVAQAGALPFLALAVMSGREVDSLLERTRTTLADRPWGVGLLGFVPDEVRRAQLAAILRHQPPFALIAGGHPDQAAELEEAGTTVYLHAPSPGLLRHFLESGARSFVFEGRECGGHVGPRSSFLLWDQMVSELVEALPPEDLATCRVLLAGGIHDARSAAAAAAVAGPLAAAGAGIGLLMGTAYLFTDEIRETGAVTELFQETALSCGGTTLLESGRGYLTRCAVTDVVDDFRRLQQSLRADGRSPEQVLEALEHFNLGRLRIASKGLAHGPEGPVSVDRAEQAAEGLFMMGDVAALRSAPLPVTELHRQVCEDGARMLRAVVAEQVVPPEPLTRTQMPVAVIGMSCILPGAPGLEQYWANILAGQDSVGEVPERRWRRDRYFDPDPASPDRTYSHWGGFLDEVDFDPLQFGLPPNTLPHVEGMQLLALHAVRDALADAGLSPALLPRETTSVVLGAGGGVADLGQRYAVRAALSGLLGEDDPVLMERLPAWSEDSFPGILVNVTAGRIANRFDLGGINCTIDAACASSLAAVHLAVRELEAGASDLVVAGGVDTMQNSFGYLAFAKTGALSPTGRCRPFDESADGIAISEGVAVVVLKRLADARRDGDRVYAVLRGIAGSSDGRARGLTAPRPEGQARALERAYAAADISPATVGLVEAHGTGTVAGDRAEVETLCRVFGRSGAAEQGCAIGSVKSMIGHTKCAAGVAGLVKVAKALHHRVLPPTIGVTTPNTSVDFGSSPFYVNTEARPWLREDDEAPRRAAVSAFGFGGTNFHAVLEEGDCAATGAVRWPAELFTFSGTPAQVRADVERVRQVLEQDGADEDSGRLDLPALAAATLAEPVRPGGRLAVAAATRKDLVRRLTVALGALDQRDLVAPGMAWVAEPGRPSVAFLYPGQGSQRAGMHRELAVHLPQMHRALQLAGLVPGLGSRLLPLPAFTEEERAASEAALTDTRQAQPALGVVAVALTELLADLGVHPDATAGHSYGEYPALWAAGAMDSEELIRISAERGRQIAACAADGRDAGGMLAVLAPADEVAACLADCDEAWLSNLNSPRQTVVSGSTACLARAQDLLVAAGLEVRALRVAAAFHSPLVTPAAQGLAQSLGSFRLRTPRVPVFANSTAKPYPDDPDAMSELLVDHLVNPVRFADEVTAMRAAGTDVFVEVGPGTTLTGLVEQTLDADDPAPGPRTAVALDGGGGGVPGLLSALGTMWSRGVPVDLARLVDLRGVTPGSVAEVLTAAEAPPTEWVVDGAGARRRSDPPEAAPAQGRARAVVGTTLTTPHPELPSLPVAGDGEVLGRFQSLMSRFLDLEREVVTTWLADGSPESARSLPDAPAVPEQALSEVTESPESEPATEHVAAGMGDAPVIELLRRLVAERTGYPSELLTDDLDLEADLGIDSIKRTEVVAAFVRSRSPSERERLTTAISGLRGLRTLRALADPLAAVVDAHDDLPLNGPAPVLGGGATTATVPRDTAALERWQVVEQPVQAVAPQRLDSQRVLLVSPQGPDPLADQLAEQLTAGLSALGADVRPLRMCADEAPDLAGVGQVSAVVQIHSREAGRVGDHGTAVEEQVTGTLAAAASCRLTPGGRFLVLSTGADRSGSDLEGAALAGALLTLAAEWPRTSVRLVELRGRCPTTQLLGLLLDPRLPVHVVYGDAAATTPALAPCRAGRATAPLLPDGGVALVTGGARGITALLAEGLAATYGARLELVSSSGPPPDAEDPATAGVDDLRELRRVLLSTSGASAAPGDVERALRELLRARQVRATMQALSDTGVAVRHHRVDVRDRGGVADLVQDVVRRHGQLDLVLHGAGVVADSLVTDKSPEQVRRVLSIKLGGALNLVSALGPLATDDGGGRTAPRLRALLLMSSVAGWFGNPGQADYAAANRALDALAARLDREWGARVASLAWGPWDSPGMVTEQVRTGFAAKGVSLIPPRAGVEAFLEVVSGAVGGSHVVLGSGPWSRTGDQSVAVPSQARLPGEERQARLAGANR